MSRICIAVHGRFHAFDLAAALLRQGHDVQLLTNYPRRAVRPWFPPERTKSLVLHGVVSRAIRRMSRGEPPARVEAALKRYFGRWAARAHRGFAPDVMHCWSGVAEESLRSSSAGIRTLARGSAHIAEQDRLLTEEEARTGVTLERPSGWIIEREEREYELASHVIVPSAFARASFINRGIDGAKVHVVNLSLRATGFVAPESAIEARIKRLRSGAPLRVLYTGMISYRKGMKDLAVVIDQLGRKMEFRLVGPRLPECTGFVRDASRLARIEAAVPERELVDVYAWGDIFVLPTIEDGFAVVLAQAQAAGLPILTSTNCGGPDIIEGGGQGWVVPIRKPEAIIAQLEWCNEHRAQVASMVESLHLSPADRGWDDVAIDFMRAVC